MEQQDVCGVAAVAARTDRALGRAEKRSLRYVRVAVRAVEAQRTGERRPVQVAFALDRSGSMGGAKMTLARQAVLAALARLQSQDRFAVTVFDDSVDLVAPAGPATPEALARARTALDAVQARGSTALHDGWDRACAELARVADPQAVARCILVTDGQANRGITQPEELAHAARQRRLAGVATTTLGIGEDFQEELLAAMSSAGGGQFYYVQHAHQLAAVLASEVGEAMDVVARGVVIELWPSPGVRLELLSDYPASWTGTHLRVELGDLVSAQQLDLLLAARLPVGRTGEHASVEIRICDGEGPLELPVQLVEWLFADHAANDRQPRDLEVLRPVTEVLAAKALLEVLNANRQGQFDQVRKRLDEAIRRLEFLAQGDAEIMLQVAGLRLERDQLSRHVEESSLKSRHMRGTQLSRGKSEDGSSRRS